MDATLSHLHTHTHTHIIYAQERERRVMQWNVNGESNSGDCVIGLLDCWTV